MDSLKIWCDICGCNVSVAVALCFLTLSLLLDFVERYEGLQFRTKMEKLCFHAVDAPMRFLML